MAISLIPNTLCALQLESKILGAGVSDIVHFIGANGAVVSWIDADGQPGGNLATSGGGGFGDVIAKTANYDIVTADDTSVFTFSGSNLFAVLPAAAPDEPWSITVINLDSTPLIVSPNGRNLNGGSGSLSLAQNQSASIFSDGTNYFYGSGLPGATGATGPTGSQGVPGTSNVPWVDLQNYGSTPHAFVFNQPTAGCTTTSGSPNVTIASGTLATALKNGQGVCIWAAGAATSQSTPSAPTITSPAVKGSQTLTYECVGYDAHGGLTAASASGTVTDAPAIFGSLPVTISSISVTSNVCSVVLASPLNNTVSAGMTLHISNVTVKTDLNGIWTIASAADTTHITFNITSADGSGTVSASSKGRVSNSAIITNISRSAAGTITVTTAQNHNFQVSGNSLQPTVVLIENCSPVSLNGYHTISSASGTSIAISTGVLSAVTGSVTAGSSTATVWDFTTVACPALSGTTVGYYIYSDSAAPGGSLALIGRCIYGECHFTDWGPSIAASYAAPAYVSTTAPVAAQNQMLSTTIASGGGTTSLVLNANAGASISALGATIMFDDAPNLAAACAACTATDSIGGAVLLSPPTGATIAHPGYIFNSPVFIPQNVNLIFGTECIVNETIQFGGFNQVTAQFGQTSSAQNFQFSTQNFCDVNGIANPIFLFGASANNGGSKVDGIGFTNNTNGVCALQVQSVFYCEITNCLLKASSTNWGNAIGVIANGGCSLIKFKNINFSYKNRFFSQISAGQSSWGPPIGAIWFRGSDNANIPNGQSATSQITFSGKHSGNGRGILFDHVNDSQGSVTDCVDFGDLMWVQAGSTPMLMFWGGTFQGVDIKNILNDSATTAIVANWASTMKDVSIKNTFISSSYSVVSGAAITNLSASGNSAQLSSQLQRVAAGSFTSSSAGSDVCSVPGCTSASVVTLSALNASAQLDIASGLAYISAIGTNSVTVNHSVTAGLRFAVLATVGND